MSVHDKYKNYINNQKQFFNELIVEDWETYNNKFWDFTRTFEINKIIKKTKPKSILDVGCGCGFHDFIFAKNPLVEKVVGIDYSNKSIKKANEAYPHPKVKRACIDFLEDDTEISNDFDLVASFQVIEHLKEYEKFLERMSSKTQKNGAIVIATPNYNRFSNRIRKLFSKAPQLSDIMHYKEFNIEDLKELGEKLGLELYYFFGYGCSLNIKHNIDKFIPKKFNFYLGRLFPKVADVLVVFFKKI